MQVIGRSSDNGSIDIAMRRFKAHYGIKPGACANIWIILENRMPPKSHHVHLMYALLFLKTYQTEHQNSSLFGVDEKTFRKYQWIFVHLLATELNLVCN